MKGGLLFIACAALLFFPITAKADCTLTSSGETRPTGTIIYNADFEVLQACKNDGTWKAMTPVTAGGAPTGCPTIGDTCSDGTIYAGLSPDGNVKMYTTTADASTGIYWNNGNNSNYTTTSQTSTTTGETNTNNLITIDSDSGTAGTQPHQAAQLCAGYTANGHNDWYLPAQDELDVLYTNKTAIGGFNVSGSFPAGWYWSSSERNFYSARNQRFSDGAQDTNSKGNEIAVRCVRK